MKELVAPSKELGYSNIFLDFLADTGSARHFYLAPGVVKVAHELDQVEFDRKWIVTTLRRQNQALGAPPEVMGAIERLADDRAVCVFSGQQAGLFGGPMLVLFKALGIIKAAQTLSMTLERDVVPIFWIAGDDHDLDEVNHTWLLDRTAEPVRIAYDARPAIELPVSEIAFSNAEARKAAIAQLRSALGESDFTSDLYDMIEHCYSPSDTFVTAFGKLWSRLLGKYGLIMFSPGDPEVKRHAVPFFQRVLKRQQALSESLTRTNTELVQSGYHVQVEKSEDATHLFYNLDGRRPVVRAEDGYRVGDHHFTQKGLLAALEEHPEKFSPDVITRPVLQSFLFPVVAQKGGPSEIAYLAQVNPVFRLFSLPPPCHSARPTATLLEVRFEKLMQEHQIQFDDFTGDIEQAINRILARSFPTELQQKFDSLQKGVIEHFNEFMHDALEFDSSLQEVGKQTRGKVDYALNAFRDKVFSAHKKRRKQTRERIYRMQNAVYTNRGLQERSLNFLYFLSRYGPDLIDFTHEQLDIRQTAHQILHLSDWRQ
jgi:bacillithiol biosynthesis cysteine-adding enzyme BshC